MGGRAGRRRRRMGAICGDMVDSLYVAPEFAGQGVGGGLLDVFEELMRDRGFHSFHLEASQNARDFYHRRGYRASGTQTPKGAWPMAKEHPA